jgi:hypothetical protein
MLRIFLPIVFVAAFVVWLLYHLLVKKDLKLHKVSLQLGLLFTVVWLFIYYLFTK